LADKPLPIRFLKELVSQRVEAVSIVGIEAGQLRTVEVENSEKLFPIEQWDDDFRARCGIASDVSGERMDVGDDDSFAALSGGTADAAA
jgi:hypothetical protein